MIQLTRSWVSEKTVDELSLVREPTKRSQSVTESIVPPSNASAVQPTMVTSVSQTTTNSALDGPRSSSGSLTSGGSTSSNSRPISLEDDLEQEEPSVADSSKKPNIGSFWLFGRKSVDHGYLKSNSSNQSALVVETYGTMQRSPRHFSFEELNSSVNTKKHSTISAATFHHHLQQLENCGGGGGSSSSTMRMHREGSQGSLASSIFRKEFWKSNQQSTSTRRPLTSFHSDPSMVSSMQRKGSFSSSSLIHPSPSTSLTLVQQSSPPKSSLPFENSKAFKHVLTSPHPLDDFSGSSKTEVVASSRSEVTSFNWE